MAENLNDFVVQDLFNLNEKNTFAFKYTVTNIAASSTVDGAVLDTMIVPTGHNFVPVAVGVFLNDTVTAGTATVKVIDNGTELVTGPEAVLDTTNTVSDFGYIALPGSRVIVAGQQVNVSITGNGTLAPTGTADAVVHLYGYFEQVV